MKDKKDGYGFIVTLLLLGWLIGSPAPTETLPADDTVAVVPSTLDENGGDPTEDASQDANAADAGVTVSETAAPASVSDYVHRIHVRDGNTGGMGSATHIGGGVYLTCGHVFGRAVSSVEIDGVATSARWSVSSGPDFAVVRTQAATAASATVNTAELSDGQSLRVVGQKTGLHEGELSPTRWSDGYRAVVCDVPTESGDSGAGVFNDAGELVGVHWGSTGNEVFFTPLSVVESMVQFVAANRNAAPFTPAAVTPRPPGADNVPSPCVLEFGAPWCGPCQSDDAAQLKAWLERSGWNVQQIDYDQNAKFVERFGVERIPTWVVIRNGEEVARYTGTSWREMLPVLNKAVQ